MSKGPHPSSSRGVTLAEVLYHILITVKEKTTLCLTLGRSDPAPRDQIYFELPGTRFPLVCVPM